MTTDTISQTTEENVLELLRGLIGDQLSVSSLGATIPSDEICVLANYSNDVGEVMRTITCDSEFANRVGAALTMFPSARAEEAIKSGQVPDNHLENLREILNICVNLFAHSTNSHLVLSGVSTGKAQVAAECTDHKYEKSLSFEVTVPRYGVGRISLNSVAR